MKRIIKIAAIVLISFAVASNIYASTVNFYGLKNSKLSNVILGAAMYGSNGSSSNTNGTSDGTSDGTSSNGSWFDSPVNTTVHCGATRVSGSQTSAGTAGASVSMVTNHLGQVSISVNYANANNTNYTQVIAAHDAIMRQCVGPSLAICTTITAIEACK